MQRKKMVKKGPPRLKSGQPTSAASTSSTASPSSLPSTPPSTPPSISNSETIYQSKYNLEEILEAIDVGLKVPFKKDMELSDKYFNNLKGLLPPKLVITDQSPPVTHETVSDNRKINDIKSYDIVLIMIVKNESKIISRCLDSIIKAGVGAICITDTGSEMPLNPTEYCPNIIQAWAKEHNMPCTVSIHPYTKETFKFSLCRTQSFLNALHYYPNAKYFLTLDADMELVTHDNWKVDELTGDQILVYQTNWNNRYINARLFKSNSVVRCQGATHESWSVRKKGGDHHNDGTSQTINNLEIKDNNDGQCKEDKFIRDRFLLENEIVDPETPSFFRHRNIFYLAQSYESLADGAWLKGEEATDPIIKQKYIDEHNDLHLAAIELYKAHYYKSSFWNKNNYRFRGWDEEKWASIFRVGQIYHKLSDYEKIVCNNLREIKKERNLTVEENEKYIASHKRRIHYKKEIKIAYLAAYKERPTRAEPLYQLAIRYRRKKDFMTGFLYAKLAHEIGFPIGDTLFVDMATYRWGIDTEIAICASHMPGQYNFAVAAFKRIKEIEDDVDWSTKKSIEELEQYFIK